MRRRASWRRGGASTLARPAIVAAQPARVLKFVPQADVAVLDPIWTAAHVTRHHSYLIFDTLYGQDSTTAVSPQMLAGQTVEDDGKLWTLTLRPGLLFHDGTPVLARDCVASIQRWGKRDIMGRLLLAATAELVRPGRPHHPLPPDAPVSATAAGAGQGRGECLRHDAGAAGQDRRLHPGDGDGRQRPVPLQRARAGHRRPLRLRALRRLPAARRVWPISWPGRRSCISTGWSGW